MKRFFLTLCALCASTALWAETEPWVSPDWSFALTYSVSSGKATITGGEFYYEDDTDLEIPATVDGYPVTAIGDEAFSGCSYLKSVTIPEGVTSIGFQAFYSCSNLTSITIPSSVTSIGMGALDECSSLPVEKFPGENWVKYEGDKRTVLIRLVSLSDGDFVIPDGVRFIHAGAFSNESELTSIEIPDSVISIGDGAFYNCTGLTSVEIPASVTSIGLDAFWGCSILYPVTFLGEPPSVASSEMNPAFPETTGYYSSKHAAAWGAVITDGTWNGLSMQMLEEETPEGEIVWNYTVSNGEATIYLGEQTPAIPQTTSGPITIPSLLGGYPVTSIGDYAFCNCTGLTSVTIPESVTTIGEWAFESCTSLTSVTIPASVTSIGNGAFDRCSGLTSVAISEGVKSIGNWAFHSCSGLTSVTLPSDLTSIGDWAFEDCSGLTSITIPKDVVSIGKGICASCPNVKITVDESNSHYKSQDGALFNKDMTILINNPGVGSSYTIPSSVTVIRDSAFDGCTGLTSVTIPESVTSIGDYAFCNCTGLTSVTIPNGLTLIDDYAFYNCMGLTSLTISESVTTIGDFAFYTCEKLASVIFLGGPVSTVSPGGFPETDGYYSSKYAAAWEAVIDTDGKWNGLTMQMVEEETPEVEITFDANGGVGGTTVTLDYGSALTAPTVTREGYTFIGWSPVVPALVPSEDTTYTAQWQLNQYTITFDANGGVGGTTEALDYGSALTAPTVTREGYTFAGWLPEVPALVPSEDTTYTAQWQKDLYSFSVTVTVVGCGTFTGADAYIEGDEVTVSATADEGWVFCGWNTDPVTPSEFYTFTMPAEDVTLTAYFAPEKAIQQYIATNGLISPEQIGEIAMKPPVIGVEDGKTKLSLKLMKATTLTGNTWTDVVLKDSDSAVVTGGQLSIELAPEADEKTAFYKFVVPPDQSK